MRPLLLSSLALLAVSCTEADPRPPPTDRFLYPSGLFYRDAPGSTRGILYVASANFDRCFDQGTLMAVDLDQVGTEGNRLPLLGSVTQLGAEPVSIEQLNVPEASRVLIQSYAGQMAFWERPGASPRLFVTARADGDFVHYVDVPTPTSLTCVGTSNRDCLQGGGSLSLTALSGQQNDLPRAPGPFGLAVDTDTARAGELWVTHLNPADSPARSLANYASYVVRLSGETPEVSPENFFSLGIPDLPAGTTNSVFLDTKYAFFSGRFDGRLTSSTAARRFLVRVVDREAPTRVVDPGLDLGFAANDARGLALTKQTAADGSRRLYVAVRAPDSLLVVTAQDLETDNPRLNVVGSVPLPNGPTEVRLIPREMGSGDLVLVACSVAGVVAVYDPDVGQVVAQVSVGVTRGTSSPQPFGMTVQRQGTTAARVFVSNFGDGRISVIDLPDLRNPQTAQLVAYLGARQDVGTSATCREEQR